MIGTLDVECQAKNPNLPLAPMTAFVNSPSSLRIRNVPKRIGDWCIRNVYVTCVYPDSSIQSVQCVLVGGIWVGTIQGTSTSGTSKNGYTIFADGTDENGNNVTGYILGKGDIEILEADGTLSPDPTRYYVKLLSAEAEQPREGDMYPTDEGYVIWQDGQANLLGTPFEQITAYVESAVSAKADLSAIHGDYIKDATGNKIYADRTIEVMEQGEPHWTLTTESNTYTLTGTRLNSVWENESERYSLVGQETEDPDASVWTLKYLTLIPGPSIWVTSWTEFYNGTFGEQSLTFPTHGFTATWNDGRTLTEDELALKSDLPTKTTDLTNDSGFITSAEIEPYYNSLTSTENTGLAKTAYTLAVTDHTSFEPIDGGKFSATLRTNRDLTNQFRATMGFVTYYPYVMSKYNGQTLSPELSLYFCKDSLKYGTTRPRSYYDGYMFRTAGAGFAIPCSEDGTPDGRLVETTGVQTAYVLMANNTTSIHSIGFSTRYSDQYGYIDQIDGQTDSISAYRASALKIYSFLEEIANKSDLPTKTSDLSNDSGFITSADVPAPSYIEDENGNKIQADGQISAISTYYTVVAFHSDTLGEFTVENDGVWQNELSNAFITAGLAEGMWDISAVNVDIGGELKNGIGYFSTSDFDVVWTEGDLVGDRSIVVNVEQQAHHATIAGTLANKSDLPTKTSQLSNDSGFITSADVPAPSYIEDENGNKIEADLDCWVADLTSPWTLTDGTDVLTLTYNSDNADWEYINGTTTKVTLKYYELVGAWDLVFYMWGGEETGWVPGAGYNVEAPSNATSLSFPENWGATRTILSQNKLATQEYVDSLIAALEARIAALENS